MRSRCVRARIRRHSGQPVADPACRSPFFRLQCLPEKERYSAERIRNLMMSMGLEDSTQAR